MEPVPSAAFDLGRCRRRCRLHRTNSAIIQFFVLLTPDYGVGRTKKIRGWLGHPLFIMCWGLERVVNADAKGLEDAEFESTVFHAESTKFGD